LFSAGSTHIIDMDKAQEDQPNNPLHGVKLLTMLQYLVSVMVGKSWAKRSTSAASIMILPSNQA
jgi:uncharacterized protein (DUF2132 family)